MVNRPEAARECIVGSCVRSRRHGFGTTSKLTAGSRRCGGNSNPNHLTAAHSTLPFGSRVRVVNKHNGRSVIVRINDRVAKKANLTIDLSRQSARALGIEGIASVALYKVN